MENTRVQPEEQTLIHQEEDIDLVVGLGASAGGLEALEAFFSHLPSAEGLVFVVILHLAPGRASHLAEILMGHAPLPVEQVTEKVHMKAGHVYVIPPDKNLLVRDGYLYVEPIEEQRLRRAPVDHFFRTLAEAYDGRAVGVILSGTGSNGSVGAKRIKEHGGLVLVQDPEEALYEEMPRNALATGVADLTLPIAELGKKLVSYRQQIRQTDASAIAKEFSEDGVRSLHEIIDELRTRTGHDFSSYKRSTVLRRLSRRMHVIGSHDFDAYLSYLHEHTDETEALFKELLISVTNFFRDPELFEAFHEKVIPKLFEGKTEHEEVRVWVPGCATGEEAYSIAILLAEYASTLDEPPTVHIFATDLDETAIHVAREGIYPASIEADVSAERLKRFFEKADDTYRVRQKVRESVLFASHSLLKDPPFSKLDLVSCRNLLIYLQHTLQHKVLVLFHYVLNQGGYLFLGSSETSDGVTSLFHTMDNTARLYQRRDVETRRPELPVRSRTREAVPRSMEGAQSPLEPALETDLLEKLQAEVAPPGVLVSAQNNIVELTTRTSPFFYIAGGLPTENVLKLVRPELQFGLQTALLKARQEKQAVWTNPVRMEMVGQAWSVRLQVRPIEQDDLIHVVFERWPVVPQADDPEEPDTPPSRAVLIHDLEETREQLHLISEEDNTSRMELNAQNEELQVINEELRTAVEELETSKEEAQSIAEEYQAINEQLKSKVKEVMQAKGDLENLIASTEIATLFLDRRLCIKRFTLPVRDLFHVRSTDVGRSLRDLNHTFDENFLQEDAEAVLETLEVREREARNAKGDYFLIHTRPYRTVDDQIDGVVVTFVNITKRKRAEEALRKSEKKYRALFEAIDEGFCVLEMILDAEGTPIDYRYLETNPAFEIQSGLHNVVGKTLREAVPGENDYQIERINTVARTGEPSRFVDQIVRLGRWYETFAFSLDEWKGQKVALLFTDITERLEVERALWESLARFQNMADTVPDVLFTMTAEGEVTYISHRMEEYTGQPPEAVMDTHMWPSLIHPDDLELAETRWQWALAYTKPYEAQHRLRMVDDSYAWFIIRARPIVGEEGTLTQWFGTLTDVDRLVRAEQGLQVLNESLEERFAERTAQVHGLMKSLTLAEHEERRRVAEILHDDLQQILFGLGMTLELLRNPTSKEEEQELREQADVILSQAESMTRSLSTDLSPPVLRSENLEDLLYWLAIKKEEMHGLNLDVEVHGELQIKDHAVRVLLYKSLHELLFNIVKHAGVDHARIRAEKTTEGITIRVEDDGKGFDQALAEATQPSRGFGLPSVQERLELIGARFRIESAPGKGTRAVITLPLSEKARATG